MGDSEENLGLMPRVTLSPRTRATGDSDWPVLGHVASLEASAGGWGEQLPYVRGIHGQGAVPIGQWKRSFLSGRTWSQLFLLWGGNQAVDVGLAREAHW